MGLLFWVPSDQSEGICQSAKYAGCPLVYVFCCRGVGWSQDLNVLFSGQYVCLWALHCFYCCQCE